jgi:response regulator RpfG family c-di-GMP phosphodiesterase
MNIVARKLVLAAPAAVASVVAPSRKRVVLLDDDTAMLGALDRLLTRAGFEIIATHEPQRAIEAVVRDGADAIVCDLHMPQMGGNIVLAMLSKAAPRTARLLLTSETDFNTVAVLAVPCSVDAFIPKRDASARLIPALFELLAGPGGFQRNDASTSPEHARALARSIVRSTTCRVDGWEAGSERLASWSSRLARQMGLPPAQVLDVELGALLHDIGEVGLAGDLAQKDGPLTVDDVVEMRRHPDIGAALLSDLSPLRRAIPVVQCHHERVDGRGYPRGLSGNAIPLQARIFQIVDAYDAITSNRPYRNRRTDAEARSEIAAHVGAQFDRDTHDAFDDIAPEEWTSIVTHGARS